MAMNLGCNIRQTARRFVAAGTGRNLRSTTGLAGGCQQARSCHSLNNLSSNKGLTFIETARGLLLRTPKIRYATIVLFGATWYMDRRNMRMVKESLKCSTCKAKEEAYESERKRMKERGVTR